MKSCAAFVIGLFTLLATLVWVPLPWDRSLKAAFVSFSSNNGLTVPPLAAAWGYTRRTFHEPFTSLSTIDTTNSGAPGFNFYPRVAWPNATGGGAWATGSVTDPSLLSIGAGGLTISDVTGTGLFSLGSAIANGAGHIGAVFTGGAYYEVSWSVNLGCANNGAPVWPTVWEQSLNFLQNGGSPFVELDHVENFPSANNNPTNDANTHEFTHLGGGSFSRNSILNVDWPAKLSTPQIYGLIVVPTSRNGGTGLIRKSYNGVTQSGMDITFSATTGSTPPADPSNPNGIYTSLDTDSFVILLSAGQGCSATIRYFDVWQQ